MTSTFKKPGTPMHDLLLLLMAGQLSAAPLGHEKALVLLFVRSDCPISNRYAPDLQRLYQEYSPRGFEFRLIYPEPGLTPAAMEEHRREYAYTIPGAIDADHQYVKRTEVTVTPEVAVFVRGGLVYRGRIDDRYVSVGKERPRALHHDLQDVLAAILTGETVAFHETAAIGCAIEKPE